MKLVLRTVAEMAGVSQATVSRVLNAQPGVSDATRGKVLSAVDVLGYERPSKLRVKSAGLVGLIVPELDNPVFPALAQVIETELSLANYTSVLCTQSLGGISEDQYVAMLLERQVAGIVFVSGTHASLTADLDRYHRLIRRPLPIVLVNGFVPGIDAPFISCDDAAAIEMSMQHLVDLGHQRIGLAVGPDRYVPVARKIAAFTAFQRDRLGAIDASSLVTSTTFSLDGGALAAGVLIDQGCTAIVCGSDMMALGAIREARARGLAVPADVSVIGFDDSAVMAFTDPPLTTARQPVDAMGAAAARALLADIAGVPTPHAEIVFRPELIVRSSTAPAQRRPRRR